ncbi:hypothetical protein Tco_0668908 [Tanacetum coccineum]
MILPLIYENRGVTQYIDDIATTTKPHLDKARDTMSPYTKEAVIAYGKFLESASNNHDQAEVTSTKSRRDGVVPVAWVVMYLNLLMKEEEVTLLLALRLEVGKLTKWKKRMLCYLVGMEPYYITCINEGLFKPKTTEGLPKTEAQWLNDERRVVNQDQRFRSIIISCLPDDIMESVINCATTKL